MTRGGGLLVKLEGQKKPGAIKWFQSDRDAQGGALKAFRSLLCWECATLQGPDREALRELQRRPASARR